MEKNNQPIDIDPKSVFHLLKDLPNFLIQCFGQNQGDIEP